MTTELAKERGYEVDIAGYNEAYKKHQEKSHANSEQKFKGGLAENNETTARLHTATHLLNGALKYVFNDDSINQRGSNITVERLRFDFSFPRKLTQEELKMVEDRVNEAIQKDIPVVMEEMSLEKAKRFIEHAGFEVGEISRKYDRKEIIGTVLEQKPKGATKLPKGSKINLVINEGDKPVPNLAGKKVKDAEKLLKAAGLRLGEVRYIDDKPAKDTIVSTTPMAGQKIAEFEKVDLTVSNGEASKPRDIYVDFTLTVEKLVGYIDTYDKDKKKEAENIKKKKELYDNYFKKNKDRRYELQVYVVDDKGRDLVFSGKKKIGENVRKKTEIVGNARIKVYADGSIIEDKSL